MDSYTGIPNDVFSIAQSGLISHLNPKLVYYIQQRRLQQQEQQQMLTNQTGKQEAIANGTLQSETAPATGDVTEISTPAFDASTEGTKLASRKASPVAEDAVALGLNVAAVNTTGTNAEENSISKTVPDDITLLHPLDLAICESIGYAGIGNEERGKRCWQNILIVGGGSLIPSFPHMLEDRYANNKINHKNKIYIYMYTKMGI